VIMPPTAPTAHADTLVVSSQSNFLRAGGPVLLQAYRVEIQGIVSSRGQDVTIVANQLAFTTPDAAIDTSGDDALNAHVPGDKPDPPVDQPGIDLPGTTGTTGARGADGARGGNVKIYATRIFGTLRIRAIGGKAGRAQDGGDGGRGGNRAIPPAEPGNDCQGLRASPVPSVDKAAWPGLPV
jgi:hypothetical protein